MRDRVRRTELKQNKREYNLILNDMVLLSILGVICDAPKPATRGFRPSRHQPSKTCLIQFNNINTTTLDISRDHVHSYLL